MSSERFDSTAVIVERLHALERKLDANNTMTNEIRISVAQQSATLNAQHASIVEHMRRTEVAEKKIDLLEGVVANFNGIMKFIGFVALLAGIAASAAKVLNP